MARSPLPPGFRFHPTDEELLVHYLKRKAAGKFVDDWIIGEIDIYKFEPAELPGLAVLQSRDFEWFFFNAQDKRHFHGSRTNRTTKAGYWKATGKDRKVTVGSCVGLKKTLIYYAGRAPHGERTDWVMHEYRLDDRLKRKMNCEESIVLCRIRRKSGLGPRNGEQYGAPVLEDEEEEVNNSVNEVYVKPSPSVKSMGEKQAQEVLPIATVGEDVRMGMEMREDFDSFLQNFIRFEKPKQDQVQSGDLMVDELLGLLEDRSDLGLTQADTTNFLDIDTNRVDNVCSLLHLADNESVMLEDMLHLVSGQLEVLPEHQSAMQAPSHNPHMDTLQSVGFVELADLEEPCHDESSLESVAFESLLLELDAGMEYPMSTSLLHDELQMQQMLQSSGHRESVRGLQHVEDCVITNELEVLLDSSQGLSDLERIQTRLSTSDERAAPSGLTLSSDQEGAFALSHSYVNRAQEQHEAEHEAADTFVENGNPLFVLTPRVEPGVDHEEQLVSNPRHLEAKLQGATSTAGPPNDSSNQSDRLASSPASPSSFARVISGLLGKVNVLPASADELPLALEKHRLIENDERLCFAAETKAQESGFTHPSSLSISSSSLNFRVKLTSSQNEKQTPRTPELELQWSVLSSAILEQHCITSCRSFTNEISMCLVRITTLALILFCMFRGFCRSTRVAFA